MGISEKVERKISMKNKSLNNKKLQQLNTKEEFK